MCAVACMQKRRSHVRQVSGTGPGNPKVSSTKGPVLRGSFAAVTNVNIAIAAHKTSVTGYWLGSERPQKSSFCFYAKLATVIEHRAPVKLWCHSAHLNAARRSLDTGTLKTALGCALPLLIPRSGASAPRCREVAPRKDGWSQS